MSNRFQNYCCVLYRSYELMFICGRCSPHKIMKKIDYIQNNMPKYKTVESFVASSYNRRVSSVPNCSKTFNRMDGRRQCRRTQSEESISTDTYVKNQVPYQDYPYVQTHGTIHDGGHMYNLNKQSSSLLLNNTPLQQNLSCHYFHRCATEEYIRKQGNGCKDQNVSTFRGWENVTELRNSREKKKPGFFFTVMSYNVLAQDLIHQHPKLYRDHDPQYLQWNKRWYNIYEHIKRFQPDVLCLQEVQKSHIQDYYSQLEKIGYKGIYKKRTGLRTDGCAIYYKSDVLTLVEYTTVEFYQPNIPILNRDNVAIIIKFCPKLHPTREFVVSTTHLLYNPKRVDVRLAQTQLLLTEIDRLAFKMTSEKSPVYLPVILTGDLNSPPDSAVYKFITESELNWEDITSRAVHKNERTNGGNMLVPSSLRITDSCQHVDLLHMRNNNEEISRSEERAIIELHNSDSTIVKKTVKCGVDSKFFGSGTLQHLFAFKSAYKHGDGENREGTTYQDTWLTVDYIFYSGKKNYSCKEEDKLKLVSRYRLPSARDLDEIHIPNKTSGSDHLSLLVKFKLDF